MDLLNHCFHDRRKSKQLRQRVRDGCSTGEYDSGFGDEYGSRFVQGHERVERPSCDSLAEARDQFLGRERMIRGRHSSFLVHASLDAGVSKRVTASAIEIASLRRDTASTFGSWLDPSASRAVPEC